MKCLICFNDLSEGTSLIEYLFHEDCICKNCRNTFEVINKTYSFTIPIHILYLYTKELESLLFQYKEGRDIALKSIYLYPYIKYIEKKYKDYVLVYMPSSKEKQEYRKFHTLENIFENIKLEKIELFDKTKDFKQSKQKKRTQIKEYIKLKENIIIPQKKLLLIDDVVTSGNTLLSAYELIKDHPYDIQAFVVSGHPYFISKWESL